MTAVPGLRIRPATAADADDIAQIYLSLARHHAALDALEYRVPTLADAYGRFAAELAAADEDDLHLVAEVEGRVVGQLDALRARPASPGSMRVPRRTASVGIAVLDDWRGRGIGTALLAEAEAWAQAVGLDALELDVATPNDGARALYERLGYEEVSRTMVRRLEHD